MLLDLSKEAGTQDRIRQRLRGLALPGKTEMQA